MIDFAKPVTTKSGLPVRILCTDAPGKFPIVGYYKRDEVQNEVYPNAWTQEGGFYTRVHEDSDLDLINVPEKIEGWINVYHIFKSKTEADANDNNINLDRKACIKISFTKGDGIGS